MTYPYLSVDARYEHVRQGGQIVSQGVLIVAGVREDGHREILAVAVANTESEATYHHLFRDLKARGLSGVRLVTSDDHQGLKAATDRHVHGASWQRCQVRFARDLVEMVGAGRRWELAADLREIFVATTREQAMATAEAVAARWEASHPSVARLLFLLFEEGIVSPAWRFRWRIGRGYARRMAWSDSTKKSSGARGWCASFRTQQRVYAW